MRRRTSLLFLGVMLLSGCTLLGDIKCEYELAPVDAGSDAGPDVPADAGPDAAADAAPDASCTPGEVRACYTGPEATKKVGKCMDGTQVCTPEASWSGLCEGEVKPAAEVCTEAADENCDGTEKCTGKYEWIEQLGEGLMREALDVAIDSAGDIVLTGYVNGIEGFSGNKSALESAGDGNIFVAKYPAAGGKPIWYKVFNGESGQVGNSVAIDSDDNVVVTGSFVGELKFGYNEEPLLASQGLSDMFVVKFNAAGEHVWSKSFGSPYNEFGNGVTIGSGDSIVLTGSQEGEVNFGGQPLSSNGEYDVFVAKFAPSGGHLWSKVFGSGGSQYGRGVAIGSEDAIILVGDFTGEVDFGKGSLANPNAADIFVVKFKSSGDTLWSKQLGGESSQHGTSVATDSVGDIVLTGSIASQVDFGCGAVDYTGGANVMAVKLSGDIGGCKWSKSFDGTITDVGTSVAVDGAGNVVLTGHFKGPVKFETEPLPNAGDRDIFLAKLDPQGGTVWGKSFGGIDDDLGSSVATDSAGNVVLTGQFRGMVNFGGQSLTSVGNGDIFVAKFAP